MSQQRAMRLSQNVRIVGHELEQLSAHLEGTEFQSDLVTVLCLF